MQESEGIKAYRQASAVSANTATDLPDPNLSFASQMNEMPASSTGLQTQMTALKSVQSAPHLVNEDKHDSKRLPTVSLSQVPLAIQQILISTPVATEPVVSHQATLPAPAAAAGSLQPHNATTIVAQNEGTALQSGMTSQSQQNVRDPQTMASQSQQGVAAMASATDLTSQDSLTPSEGPHTGHPGRCASPTQGVHSLCVCGSSRHER